MIPCWTAVVLIENCTEFRPTSSAVGCFPPPPPPAHLLPPPAPRGAADGAPPWRRGEPGCGPEDGWGLPRWRLRQQGRRVGGLREPTDQRLGVHPHDSGSDGRDSGALHHVPGGLREGSLFSFPEPEVHQFSQDGWSNSFMDGAVFSPQRTALQKSRPTNLYLSSICHRLG